MANAAGNGARPVANAAGWLWRGEADHRKRLRSASYRGLLRRHSAVGRQPSDTPQKLSSRQIVVRFVRQDRDSKSWCFAREGSHCLSKTSVLRRRNTLFQKLASLQNGQPENKKTHAFRVHGTHFFRCAGFWSAHFSSARQVLARLGSEVPPKVSVSRRRESSVVKRVAFRVDETTHRFGNARLA